MVNHRDRDVPIEVTSRHQHVSDKTRALAIEKAQKLTRFNGRISRIQVLLDEEHDKFLAEVIIHVESNRTLVAKESADGFRVAIDSAMEKLGRQLKKDNEKRHDHKHDPAGSTPGTTEPDAGDEETYDDIVRQDLS